MSEHASIVIRTYNEQKWIRHCLTSVFDQNYPSFDVVIVDSNSTDNTLRICDDFQIKRVISIDDYLPGDALNKGILCNPADFYICLSAHCIPCTDTWLSDLLDPFSNQKIVGVYGRQLPLPSSLNIDKRDLLMTFSCESRTTSKDGFFHNANSALRHSYVIDNLFDHRVTNAEDHLWGRTVISNELSLHYSAEASVFHHHGLHQGSPPKRVNGVLSQLEQCIDPSLIYFPDSLTPKGSICYAFILLNSESEEKFLLYSYLSNVLKDCTIFKKYIFILHDSHPSIIDAFSDFENDSLFYCRNEFTTSLDADLFDLLQEISFSVEQKLPIPDHYMFINASYLNISCDHIDNIYRNHLCNNYDSTYSGTQCYDCIMVRDKSGEYLPVSDDMLKPRIARDPLYRISYGLGSVFNAYFFQDPHSISHRFGIYQVEDPKLSFKAPQ